MSTNNNIEIESVSHSTFKIAVIKNDSKDMWTVVDKYGNVLTPFLDGDKCIIPYSDSSSLVLGIEKGKRKLFDIYCDELDPDKSKCKKINFPFEVTNARFLGNDRFLFNTSNGLCFVSDFYDALYSFEDSNHNNHWIYEKEVRTDNYMTTLTGEAFLDGTVSKTAYDTFFHKNRNVEVNLISPYRYESIDTNDVYQDLVDREIEDQALKVKKS